MGRVGRNETGRTSIGELFSNTEVCQICVCKKKRWDYNMKDRREVGETRRFVYKAAAKFEILVMMI